MTAFPMVEMKERHSPNVQLPCHTVISPVSVETVPDLGISLSMEAVTSSVFHCSSSYRDVYQGDGLKSHPGPKGKTSAASRASQPSGTLPKVDAAISLPGTLIVGTWGRQ